MRQKSNTPDAADLITRASYLVNWLDQQKIDVLVPTVILGELLAIVPVDQHAFVTSQLGTEWMFVDYNVRAAQQFAVIRYDTAFKTMMDDIRKGNPYATRKQLLADAMIIATAIAHGADKIYSHDDDFLRLAAQYTDAENILHLPIQTSFIQDDEAE